MAGLNTFFMILGESAPEIRIAPIPPSPGGVIMAAIVSRQESSGFFFSYERYFALAGAAAVFRFWNTTCSTNENKEKHVQYRTRPADAL